eukprot:NODE_703_length_4591_cov_0.807435.p4 type:complete len:130 gc:universal NODE_703_length_4591_cov_0.807435:1131-1520(+)
MARLLLFKKLCGLRYIRKMNVTCQWNGCFVDLPIEEMVDHVSNTHIGYKRNDTFQGKCKWICVNRNNNIPNCTECHYTGGSRHLLLSHIRRHFETNAYICEICKKASYKWKVIKINAARYAQTLEKMQV